MSEIDDILQSKEDYDSKFAIKKTRKVGCFIQLMNIILLFVDITTLVLENINGENGWYFAFIPIGMTLITIICTFIELSTINFYLTTKFNCIVSMSLINVVFVTGVHVAMALPVTTNISQRGKYFMWGGSGICILILVLTIWKAVYMCKYMSNRRYSTQVDYSLLSSTQKKQLLRSSLYPDG